MRGRTGKLLSLLASVMLAACLLPAIAQAAPTQKSAHDPVFPATENTEEMLLQLSSVGTTSETYKIPAWTTSWGNNAQADYPKIHITCKNSLGSAMKLVIRAQSSDEFYYWSPAGNALDAYKYTTTNMFRIRADLHKDTNTYQIGTRVIYLHPGETYTFPIENQSKGKSPSVNVTFQVSELTLDSGSQTNIIQGGDTADTATPIIIDDNGYWLGGFWGTPWYSGSSASFTKQYYSFIVNKRSVYFISILRKGGSSDTALCLYDEKGNSLNTVSDFTLTSDMFKNKSISGHGYYVTLNPGKYYFHVSNKVGYNDSQSTDENGYVTRAGTPRVFTLAMTRRDYIPATAIKYTPVTALPTSMNIDKSAEFKYKVDLLPENTDDRIFDERSKQYVTSYTTYGAYKATAAGAKVAAINHNAYTQHMSISLNEADRSTYTKAALSNKISLAVIPKAPKASSLFVQSTHNKVSFKNNLGKSSILVVEQYKGGKWVQVKTVKDAKTASVSGLKANSKYKFRYRCIVNGAKSPATSAVTIPTGTTAKPKIKSVKTSNVKVWSSWVSGHWDTAHRHWTSGYYKYFTSAKVKVTLAKKPAGVKYVWFAGNYVKLSGKTFTTSVTYVGKLKGKAVHPTLQFSSNKAYGALGKYKIKKSVRLQ